MALRRRANLSFEDFLLTAINTERGRYNFSHHRPMLEIARQLNHQSQVWIMKGAQIGFSTLALGWCLYQSLEKNKSIGYALPTKIFSRRFLSTRIMPLIWQDKLLNDSATINQTMGVVGFQKYRTLRLSPSYLYMLGMETISDAISIPLDILVFDEVDILNEENMTWADDRLAASANPQRLYFSVGMNPGLGVDAGYQQSNQNVWLVKCASCGQDDQVMEEAFPQCVKRIDGEWTLVCERCGSSLDVQAQGRWVMKYPGRDVAGYRIPQLIIPHVNLNYIMDRYQKVEAYRSKLAKFNCSVLAMPDAGGNQMITAQQCLEVLGDYDTRKTANWTVGGADVGDKCHVAFADIVDGKLRFIRMDEVHSDRMVEEMSAMITAMGCRRFVIDAKPFRTEARKLARLHPDVVVLQYFKEQSLGTGSEEHEGVAYRTVSENRHDSLDAYCDLFAGEKAGVLFPRYLHNLDFLDTDVAVHHLKGSQKVDTKDARLGRSVPSYRKSIENHYLMACNNVRKAWVLAVTEPLQTGLGIVPVFGEGG